MMWSTTPAPDIECAKGVIVEQRITGGASTCRFPVGYRSHDAGSMFAFDVIEIIDVCLLLAQMRSAGCFEQCPLSRAHRKAFARTELFPEIFTVALLSTFSTVSTQGGHHKAKWTVLPVVTCDLLYC